MIRRHFRAIIVALGILGVVIFLHRMSPDRWSGMADKIMHSLHAPGFSALAVLAFAYLRNRRSFPSNYGIAAAVAFSVGVISEAAQIPGPRDAQFSDLVVNSIGIAAGLGTIALFDPTVRAAFDRLRLAALATVTVGTFGYTFIPTLLFILAWAAQLHAAPVILTFEHFWERYTYSRPRDKSVTLVTAPDDWPVVDSTIARSKEHGKWGIFVSIEPPRDWSGYRNLSFVAATDIESLALAVGIWDMRPDRTTYQNRHYERITIDRQPKRYFFSLENIPVKEGTRPFDLSHVSSLVFSASNPGSDAELLLDDIRLER